MNVLFKAKYLGIGLAGVIAPMVLNSCKSNTPKEEDKSTKSAKTNIIYLMLDDAGYGDFGCYGQQKIKTPNIDKLASEGMMFTQHYAGTPVCAPSRCNLMTGKHNGHSFVRGNKQVLPHGQLPLKDSEITVAELMKTAGYVTGAIGKWGLGIEGSEGDPNAQGWDFFYGYTDQVLAHNYYPEYIVKNGEHIMLNNVVKYLDSTEWHKGLGSYSTKKVDYSNDLFTTEALNFLDEYKDTSFFLYLPYTIPHDNGEAPEGQKQEVPDYGIYTDMDWPSDDKGYAAMITRLDGYVGEIVTKLKEHDLAENTLLIVTSDNGPMHWAADHFDSNGPFRGGKRDPYEGGGREPFIAWWPGTIQAGTSSDHISAFWDFMPTACEIAGITSPEDTDGISYLPTLLGKDSEQKKHDYMYFEFFVGKGWQSVRKGNWKGIRLEARTSSDGKFELYDLSTDVGEEKDVAAEYPDIVEELKAIMKEAHVPSKEFAFDYE